MICPICGTEVDDSVQVCPNCGNEIDHDHAIDEDSVDESTPIAIPATESAGPEEKPFSVPKEDMESPILPVASLLCSMLFGVPGLIIGVYGYFHCKQSANKTMCLVGAGVSVFLLIICAIAVGIVIAN